MELVDIIEKIERLKTELDALRPMSKENEDRLWKKIRLDWNYNSNHIEGNTLTYGETKLLLLFDKITGDHEAREIEEMKGHDVALHIIREMAEDKERPLTESFIKELNKIILVKPFWKEAITPDGQPTRRLIDIGDYKKFPNSVRLQNGEIFPYADPIDVHAKMETLMAFYRKDENKIETHPVALAALFHYDFVRIHPFDDGNGRVSRLLMNYILMKKGYPPVIIQSKDKSNYLFALNKADAGDNGAFVKYIGDQLVKSLEISIKAAKGEDIEEDDDLDKELELIRRRLASKNKERKTKRTNEACFRVLEESILPFIDRLSNDKTLKDFYIEMICKMEIITIGANYREFKSTVNILPVNEYNIQKPSFTPNVFGSIKETNIIFEFCGFKYTTKDSNLSFTLAIKFVDYQYDVVVNPQTIEWVDNPLYFSIPYQDNLIEEDQNKILREIKKQVLEFAIKQENS